MDKKGGWGLWLRSFVQQEHVSRRKIIWLILATGFSRLSINISNQDNILRSIEPDNTVRQPCFIFLEKELRKQDYLVLSLSFEAADEYFESLGSLAEGLSLDIEECLREQNVDEKVFRGMELFNL